MKPMSSGIAASALSYLSISLALASLPLILMMVNIFFMLFSFSETLVNFLSSLFTSTLINFQRYILLMFQTLAFSQICCWKMILLYLYLNQWFIWSQFVYNVNCWVGVLLDFCCLSCTSSCFSTLCLVFLLIVHLASFTKVSGTYLFEYLSRFSTLLQWFVWGQSTLYWLP